MILDRILKEKEQEVAARKSARLISDVKADIGCAPEPLNFIGALNRNFLGIPAVIAEVKKASPSKGLIRPDFDPEAIAKSYESAGASAISVLTDEKFFQGSLDYLVQVRRSVSIPILRKDFLIDEYQVYEARAAGADAVLLIVAALEKDQLKTLMNTAGELGMDCLVEVHNEAEMEIALSATAPLLGINNRNLQTFDVSLETTERLLRSEKLSTVADIGSNDLKSRHAKVVSESGIFTRADMEMLGAMGVDAVLIGEALMRQNDIAAKLRELIG